MKKSAGRFRLAQLERGKHDGNHTHINQRQFELCSGSTLFSVSVGTTVDDSIGFERWPGSREASPSDKLTCVAGGLSLQWKLIDK